MRVLIVGGSSVAGQAALAAVRKLDAGARIVGTTSRADALPAFDRTIGGIDFNQVDAAQKVEAAWAGEDGAPDVLVHTPAFGPVGYPIRAVTEADRDAALAFSVRPMVSIAEALGPRRTIGFSAFYWLPHTLAAYGAMAYAKLAQEQLAVRMPDRYTMIRAGTFASKATRGIALLLQRAMKDTPHDLLRKMGADWRESGMKFKDFFFQLAFRGEQGAFGSRFAEAHRATDAADLEGCITQALSTREPAPIHNVIGAWQWIENDLPGLPEDFLLETGFAGSP